MRRPTLKIPGGYIVAIEGIDAVGKNTHSLKLHRWLTSKGVEAARMSFPDYGTPIGKQIKSFLSGRNKSYPAELRHLLFAANRWEKYDELESRLQAGEAIIIDRYTESNLVYGKANGLDTDWLDNLEKGLPRANLVIVLDAPIRSLASRRSGRNKDAYERSSALQARAKRIYRELATERGWNLIDASGSVAAVQAAVLEAMRQTLKRDRGITI